MNHVVVLVLLLSGQVQRLAGSSSSLQVAKQHDPESKSDVWTRRSVVTESKVTVNFISPPVSQSPSLFSRCLTLDSFWLLSVQPSVSHFRRANSML